MTLGPWRFNIRCLAAKKAGWNNCLSASSETWWELKVEYLSPYPAVVTFLSTSSMSQSEKNESMASNREEKKNLFITARWPIRLLVLFHQASLITSFVETGSLDFWSLRGRLITNTQHVIHEGWQSFYYMDKAWMIHNASLYLIYHM